MCPLPSAVELPGYCAKIGRGRVDAHTFLTVIPGCVASIGPSRPTGEPRCSRCGTGRYGWLPVPTVRSYTAGPVSLSRRTSRRARPVTQVNRQKYQRDLVEAHLVPIAVAGLAVTRDDAQRDRTRRAVVAAAVLGRHPVVVVGDVETSSTFLHRQDLGFVAGVPFVGAEDHHGELALLKVLGQPVSDVAPGRLECRSRHRE